MGATLTQKMTVAELVKWAAGENARLSAAPDADRSKYLSDVLAKAADVADPEGTLDVEVPVEPSASVLVAELTAKIDALVASVEKIGAPAEPDAEAVQKAEDMGLALQLAIEALEGYSSRLLALKDMLTSGAELTSDDIMKAFAGEWDVRNAVDLAIASMGKGDDAPSEETLKRVAELLVAKTDDSQDDTADDAADDSADAADSDDESESTDDEPEADVEKRGGRYIGDYNAIAADLLATKE